MTHLIDSGGREFGVKGIVEAHQLEKVIVCHTRTGSRGQLQIATAMHMFQRS